MQCAGASSVIVGITLVYNAYKQEDCYLRYNVIKLISMIQSELLFSIDLILL